MPSHVRSITLTTLALTWGSRPVLAHGIAEGQVFLDGNKRTALLAMLTFLRVNGVVVTATDDELADWILDLSRGDSVEMLAARIRSYSSQE